MSQRSSRNQKIEPLDYAEMAQAPALKGSVSFLDITPGDVQSGFTRFGMAGSVASSSGNEMDPGDETYLRDPSTKSRTLNTVVTPIRSRASKIIQNSVGLANDMGPRTTPLPGAGSIPDSETFPGDETYSGPIAGSARAADITPGRGRSKVRRCVLAQDGHSLGEEAIYQVLWRSGRPESSDPNGSRAVRMGAADVGYKVNMAKKNVRQNISKLFEKLAIEILEDFETMSSQARLYRVYSYKQILERRRAAGLEYVLRNKGVVFCSKGGEGLVSSPAYVSRPGGETSIRPAPPKKRRVPVPEAANPYKQALPLPRAEEQSEDADLIAVSQALNRFWPVDQAAAEQLLRSCRLIRPDARADEISFFVREKLELARQNKSITNPTGLILSTVPQLFVGPTFLDFRHRMERQATLEAEESARKELQRIELDVWMNKEREDAERVVNDDTKTQKERDAAERTLRQFGPREF